jgi:hypothetical protein
MPSEFGISMCNSMVTEAEEMHANCLPAFAKGDVNRTGDRASFLTWVHVA